MKRTALAVAAATVLLLLAGCTSTTTSETVTVSGAADRTVGTSQPTPEAAAPLVAETPAVADDEAVFLDTVRAKLRPDNVIPNATDEQLLAAGEAACDKIATTENTNTISVIEGEQPNGLGSYPDSNVIVSAARASLCS